MRRLPDRTARRRAVLAVAALYGLLLQAFLVTLAPVGAEAREPGVICAAHDGGAPADDGASCPQQLCCLAAHLAQPLTGPLPVPSAFTPPWRRSAAPAWRAVAVPPARGPPNRAVSSRGPPAA